MLLVCEIDNDVLGMLALLDEEWEMREIILSVVDPLIALGPIERVLTPTVLTQTYGAQVVLSDGTSVALT